MANNGKSRWLKWLVILIVVGGVAGAVVWHFVGARDAGPEYQNAEITRGDIIQAVTATGTLNPVTNVTVGSQISGNIQKLYADWNSRVKANEVIAQLDPSSYQAAVAQAEGDLASASATMELNQIEAKRADELFKSKLISESDHDTAIANLHQAQAVVKIKQAALDTAKVNLARCTIYSPVDGIVISRNVDVGQTVAASLSAPTLFIIANDLTQMEIDANIAEADVGGVEEKQDVTFTVDAFPSRTFNGSVVQVRYAPTNYQNVVTYDAVISVGNKDMKLKPGMTANVSVVVAERKDALKVPNAALRFRPPEVIGKDVKTNGAAKLETGTNGSGGQGGNRGEGHGHDRGGSGHPHVEHQPVRTVYVQADPVDPTKLKPVQVKVGISDGVFTEVIDGLKEGDQVVTGLSFQSDQAGGGRPNNPFGGGFRRM
ncbi:MAG TPA: efflux RND transporter periplasmic adaptor subunit [Verrucomicrobiae bacterium]|jgi:HlyD family secretion protein|nr:efflux RND transporter periplasmic adaptor subunit [Verrucomicrobiae bacterium]